MKATHSTYKLAPEYVSASVADDPELVEVLEELVNTVWSKPYILGRAPRNEKLFVDWNAIYEKQPECQIGLFEAKTGCLLAAINSLALRWDQPLSNLPDTGWDWAVHTGLQSSSFHIEPNILAALAVTVAPAARKRGMSGKALALLKAMSRDQGLQHLIVPVRPLMKHQYPDIPLEEYIRWTNEDGLPHDPWLRAHARIGGRISHVCSNSMTIRATLPEWSSWTGIDFDRSTSVSVSGMPGMLHVDCALEIATYVEPNVWVIHAL
jgi:hypothetical protein